MIYYVEDFFVWGTGLEDCSIGGEVDNDEEDGDEVEDELELEDDDDVEVEDEVEDEVESESDDEESSSCITIGVLFACNCGRTLRLGLKDLLRFLVEGPTKHIISAPNDRRMDL